MGRREEEYGRHVSVVGGQRKAFYELLELSFLSCPRAVKKVLAKFILLKLHNTKQIIWFLPTKHRNSKIMILNFTCRTVYFSAVHKNKADAR